MYDDDHTNPKNFDMPLKVGHRKAVHAYVEIDYKTNCSYVTNPNDLSDVVTCLTEEEEANAIKKFGFVGNETSDDALCEWAYFWMDRS